MASSAAVLGAGRISCPYGLMYHILSMREGRSAVCSFAKSMYCLRKDGREPGRLASSTRSCAESSLLKRRVSVMGLSGRLSSATCAAWEEAARERGLVVVSAEGADGCEMAFCPVMMVPSSRPAEMWCEKLELIAGMTWTLPGTPVMEPRRYIALSKLPVKSRAPVRNKFPTDADWKLKTEEGRALLTISRLMVLKKERMSSRFEEVIFVQRGCRASTMSSHSTRALAGEEERRWLNKAFILVDSGDVLEGMSRTSRPDFVRDRMDDEPTKAAWAVARYSLSADLS